MTGSFFFFRLHPKSSGYYFYYFFLAVLVLFLIAPPISDGFDNRMEDCTFRFTRNPFFLGAAPGTPKLLIVHT